MKSLWKAILMAVGLFVYGYFLSTAGHDHMSHSKAHMDTESGHDDHSGHAH